MVNRLLVPDLVLRRKSPSKGSDQIAGAASPVEAVPKLLANNKMKNYLDILEATYNRNFSARQLQNQRRRMEGQVEKNTLKR